ncbi:uncharacterized protein LOC111877339 [Lactuca sativa]|uniref:uncharacterized protein LOC111877339 n=1 Tax=Lactuca sativa TaxID=4236 RepID=UPI000CD989EE|nr:uncharacterized protein LOC111877339 [Lactuca sativa]
MSKPVEKPYGITNIKSVVPLPLDLERLNYDAWRELFQTHCISYGVSDHLVIAKDKPDDEEWNRINYVVKSWLYATLFESLLQMILKRNATASQIWKNLEDLFRDNKDAKVIQLDNELRNIVMGDSSVTDYCARINSIAYLLDNIESTCTIKE